MAEPELNRATIARSQATVGAGLWHRQFQIHTETVVPQHFGAGRRIQRHASASAPNTALGTRPSSVTFTTP